MADRDIIDIPQLFKTEKRKAVAFFPDLVRCGWRRYPAVLHHPGLNVGLHAFTPQRGKIFGLTHV